MRAPKAGVVPPGQLWPRKGAFSALLICLKDITPKDSFLPSHYRTKANPQAAALLAGGRARPGIRVYSRICWATMHSSPCPAGLAGFQPPSLWRKGTESSQGSRLREASARPAAVLQREGGMARSQQAFARTRRLIESSDSPGRSTPLSFPFLRGAKWLPSPPAAVPRLVTVVTEGR